MPALKHADALVHSSHQVVLSDISYTSFTYPGDQEALAALKAIPGAGPLLAWLDANFSEQITHLNNNEQMVRVNANNYGSLFALVERCCAILSCKVPDVYITTNPEMNAYTSGQRRTCIVLHSALVEALTPDELCFVIGHEIGHIKAAHGLYRQLASVLVLIVLFVINRLLRMPIGRAWEALREDEIACEAMGVDITRVKLSAFALGSCWAGFAGVIFAAKTTYINPSSFTFMESAMILSMVVLGGMGSITGVAIAAFILILAPEYLRAFSEYRMLIFGAIMVIMMIFRPQGLISGERRRYRISALHDAEGGRQ